MEPKRELSSVDLRALSTELSRYEGAKVDKVYLYGDDRLRFKLRDFDRGRVDLFVQVADDTKRAHTVAQERVPDAPGRPPEFAKTLRSHIEAADLVDVRQYEFDRILVFEFERPDQDVTIVAELFGEGNVAVLDENGEVLRSLETVRLKSRTVAPGSVYEFPESRLNPLAVSYEGLAARMDDSDTDVVRTLATQFNLGGLYAEEVCSRAGIEKTMDIDDADESVYRAVHDALQGLKADLAAGNFDPRLYAEREDDGDAVDDDADGEVVDATPFPLAERERAGLAAEAFDSFNAALDTYFHRLSEQEAAEATGRDRPDFEAEIETQKRIIAQQEGAIEDFEAQAERERRRAELLYERYDLVDEVLSTVVAAREEGMGWDDVADRFEAGAERGIPAAEAVVDVDGSEGTVTVELDGERIALHPEDGVEKNADRLYTEAKRIEDKREGAEEAVEETRAELEALQRRREEWDAEDESAEAGDDGDEDEGDADPEVDWLSRSSVPVTQSDYWYERFRWFHTSDGYLVIGGRDADDNEALVKKYLDKHDRFFHSQAHGGPVTVLKASGPSEPSEPVDFPEASRRQAAQFAVSYSSVWKDGRYAGDAYAVDPEQVSKTPESGEYLEKGGFAIRGDRDYHEDVPAAVAVGITCEPETRVVGGPPAAVEPRAETSVRIEPGKFAQNDAAVKCYRTFKERFADESFVRKVASADRIQEFLPPGGSDIVDD
ncbi:MAG: ribosome rescue protein RqcH [Halolamina sp.]